MEHHGLWHSVVTGSEDNALRARVLTSRAGAQRSRAGSFAKNDTRLSSYEPAMLIGYL